MDYATIEVLIPGYLPGVSSDSDLAALAGMLTRASRTIDTRTRRHADAFAAAAEEASAEVWYGDDSPVLLTGEYIAGSVATVTAPTGYLPDGWNEFRRREVSTGVMRVGLHTATADSAIRTPRVVWKRGVPYTVTARWGFAETPAEIVEATLKLVRAWWRAQTGEVSGTQGDLQAARAPERGFPKEVDDLIAPYVLEEVERDEEAGTIERAELLDADHNPTRGGWGW
jgi:hypothetical protein